MKKILIISAVFPPEPVVSAQLSYDIAKELAMQHKVIVLSPKPTRPQDFNFESSKIEHTFEHVVLDSFTNAKSQIIGRMRESLSFGRHCANFIKNNKNSLDVIYINSWPIFSQYYIVKAAKEYNIPTVIHIQDIYPESLVNKLPIGQKAFFNMLLPFDKYILKNSSQVLCISENMVDILSKTRNLAKEKFNIVANWQNEENFIYYRNSNHFRKLNSDIFKFMYLGNNGPVAGVELLIEAFVKADIPNSQLIIAGAGSRTEACKQLAQNFKNSNIAFVSVPEGKVPEIQNEANVMLLPVKKGAAMSSIPSKLPAYMFSEKPIIGSLDLESDTARAIIESGCGIVIEPENKEKLAEAMQQISTWNLEKLNVSGEKGFNYAMKYLSKATNLKKVIDIIIAKT